MKSHDPVSKSSTRAAANRRKQRVNQSTELLFEKLEPRQMLHGAPGELVFEAGFEDVVVPVGTFRFFNQVSGFTATGDPVEVQNDDPAVGPASRGVNLLELDGTNGVFVDISNVPSSGLVLQGDYSARRGFDAVRNSIQVLWNGELVSTLARDGRGQTSTNFRRFEIKLTGQSPSGRLEFRSTTENDQLGAGGLLDDIKVFKNQAPVLAAIGDRTINELQTLSVQLAATDPDSAQSQLRYSALRAPVGSTLDPVTGLFTWTPNSFAGGLRFGIDVKVTDEAGFSDTRTFRVTVNDTNQGAAPVLADIGDRTINAGQPLSVQLVATDPDSAQNQLRYSTSRSPVGSTLDPLTGLFTWTPNSFAGGLRFGIDVKVTDETGLSDTQTFRVSVNDVAGSAPVLADIGDRSILEGRPLSVQLVATDPDSAQSQLRYSASRSPVGSTLDPISGLFTWTPNSFAAGLRFGIDVRVTDETGLSDQQTFRVSVEEDESNGSAPVLQRVDDQTVTEGEQISIQLVATDEDSNPSDLRFEALRSPVTSSLDPLTGLFTWTPNSFAGGLTFGVDVKVTDETGLSDTITFRIGVQEQSDEILLMEGQDFETTATRNLTIMDSMSELIIDFQPTFDVADTDFINDAFEVGLFDLDGNSLVHTVGPNRDAFFNLTEGEAPAGGVNTVLLGQRVKLDLSHIADGTAANLVFRLVNNDDDINTQVRITSIETTDNQLNTPVGATADSARPRVASIANDAALVDVTGSFEIDFAQTSFNQQDNGLLSQIRLTNVGQVAIVGRLLAVFENPTSEQIALLRPDGRLPDGRFFLDVTSADGSLAMGESTTTRDLGLLNPNGEQFDFELTILAEVNRAPSGFSSAPPSDIEAGRTVLYTAVAADPDGQVLQYSIVTGHEAMAINPDTGELTWMTTVDEIGSHVVTLRATDPFGLFVEQTFALEVHETLQNRPPNFVTDPVTEATASSGFEITTVGVGNSPAGTGVISGFRGPRLVTANAADQTIGVYAGENNDRFDDATMYGTGFPTADGQLFDVGYSVDVGLPEFRSPFDVNEVEGMDQGDLNGDGSLDLVVMYSNDGFEGGLRYQLVISALLGDGDGNFGDPIELYRHSAGTGQYDPRNLVVRDFNNDGALDVLATERQQDTRLISILGNGDGSFANATEQRFVGGPLIDFHVADIDEDGTLDLIGRKTTINNLNFDSAWSRGVGDGTFETPVSIGSARFTNSINQARPHDVLDLNEDGHLDFAIMNGLAVQIYHSDGAGNFTLESELSVPSPGADGWLRGGDFNGDGAMDLVYHDGFNSDINLLLGDASGVDFTLQRGPDAARGIIANYAGGDAPTDVDNDGDLDLIFGNSNSDFVSPKVALNDGSGNFTIIEYAMVDFSQTDVRRYDPRDIARGGMFGDYNSDGVTDFSYFTGGGDFNGVGIRLGTRPGEFGGTRTIPWTANTRSQDATPGDFNGDGIIDLVDTANDRIYLGLGDGSFAEPFPAFGFSGLGYASVADFNLDGIDDIVAPRSNRYFAALANGDGTFTISDDQLVGDSFFGYSSTDIADFNGDGYPDFIAKASVETHIDVHLNDPANPGVFSRTFRVTLPPGSQGINVSNWQESYAVADFTGDGILDLSFAERDSTGDGVTKVVVMAGDGAGDFMRHSELDGFDAFSQVVSAAFYEPGDFSAGDLDLDGDVDLISATNYGARIFLNDGTGNFEFFTHLESPGVQQRGRDSWLVDFDQDGQLDFVQTGSGSFGPLSVRLGNGDATFQPAQTIGLIAGATGLISRQPFADLDGDGHLDFVYGTGGAGNYVNYTASIFAGRRDDLVDLISVDLNGDGNEEVLAVQEQMDRLQIFVGNNLGGFTRQPDLQTGRAPRAVAASDLDGDGRLELLTVNRAGRSISVYSGDLVNGFTSLEFLAGAGGIDVLTADINGDGNQDVFVLDDVDNVVRMYTGDGTSTLGTPTPLPLGDKPSSFTLADAHGDGLIDVVITLPETNRLMILPGDGNGAFGQPTYVNVAAAPSDVAVVDLNNDGFPELAATLPELHVLSVAYGLGNSQFSRTQQVQVGQSPAKVTLADADEDGRLDLVVTNRGDDTVSVIYNRFDPNEVYRYDADAVDPDNDVLAYSIVDGPGGLIINQDTGALLWAASPNQVGVHDVTIAADDGRGGVATQSFKIEVEPARENSSPLIATSPVEQIGAGEAFEYHVKSIDAENDALRYRLLAGPDGASIDPVTGLVQWNGNADGAVSINRFATTHGDIRVPVGTDSSLSLNSLTIEGWFNTQNLTSSSFASLFRVGSSYNLLDVRYFGDAEVQLDLFDGNLSVVRFSVPIAVKVDQWRHFALSIDDVASTFELLVDGQSVLSGALPSSFVYDSPMRLDIGAGFATYSGLVDNFRVWNQARSGEQIREGLSRQYEGDPNLVLDYRFEDNDSIVVRDRSGNGNVGYFVENRTSPIVVPGGLAEAGSYSFVVGVEDGRGGFDEQSFTLDIVPELRGSIRGTVFDDFDGDGSQDDGSENPAEPGLAGWHLFIDSNSNGFADPDEAQAITDADGHYLFEGLLPGDYPVRVSPVAGYKTPTEFTATVAPEIVTETDPDAATKDDLAVTQLALSQIQGQLKTEDGQVIGYWNVYADLDEDGQRGIDEPSSMTDRDGVFSLFGLDAGSYTVRTEVPAGWREASDRLVVDLAADEISTGNDIVLAPTNTSVTGGVRFVTTPPTMVTARDIFRYAAVATSIVPQAITYDLSLAPEGVSIDPATGLVAWRPNGSQVGEHRVILRATAKDGSISLHDFSVNVNAPNTPPAIVSIAPVVGFVGKVFAYDLVAQDSENESITFALANGPTNATLDPDSGQLRWTPAAGNIGDVDFAIVARDASGAASIQEFTVTISADQPNATPFNVTPPRDTVGLRQNYASRVLGVDQLGRPLTWTKTSGPASLTVSEDGGIRWTAGASDLGPNTIELTATNVDGETEDYSFTINVVGQPVLNAPEIVSEPTRSTVIDAPYRYDVQVNDAEDNLFAYTLLNAPFGMSIHPSRGTIRWTPAADQLGETDVTIEATDPDGLTATQTFKLNVSRFGGPPIITSTPPTEVNVGGTYLYSVITQDAEGDPLTYRLLTAPTGVSIVETTGEISWTPTADQLGQQEIVIEVSDGIGGAATQAFAILVGDGIVNLPPVIESSAPRFSAVGTEYSYQIVANDPESTSLTYAVSRGPTGLSVDGNGLVSWTPTAGQVGQFVVTLVVTDAGGASAIESFELDVLAENRDPVINSTAPVASVQGAAFGYDVLVSDADLDPLQYELVRAPAGAEINAFGQIRWDNSNASLGAYDFEVKVSDPRGGEATQAFTVDLVADTVAPTVSLIETPNDASRNILPWQGPFRVFVRAIDNVGIASLTLTANGQEIPLDADGTATFEFEDWFFETISATATAVDTSGNVSTETITFDFDVPEGWSTNPGPEVPRAAITSPSDNGTATGFVSIVGTADHEDFGAYILSYRRADDTSFTEIVRSTDAVVNGELGVWDTTLLRNDEYVLRLQVATTEGTANVAEVSVGLAGELKLGNFQLSFTDMVIPVAGIPVEITRVYDTLDADVEGELGFGWRLEFRDTDLRVGLPESGLEDIGIHTAFRPGTKVYLNVPGEGRVGFTFNPEIRILPGFGGENLVLARPRFVADPGVTASLSAGVSGFVRVNEFGELIAPGNIPYNPASPGFGGAYVVTTRGGVVYRINGADGKLESATDRNGNVIQFSSAGIDSQNGTAIRFDRDASGRIVSINDLAGNKIQYQYNGAGDLISTTDREGNITRITYRSDRAHYLESLIDPLGRTGTRAEYDQDGRLISAVDVNGRSVQLSRTPGSTIQRVTDKNGNEELLEFDNFGRVLSTTDGTGATQRFEYDANGYLASSTDALGNTTRYESSALGDLLSTTDANGNVTRLSYNRFGQVTSMVDSLGNTVVNEYDDQGNLIRTIDRLGQSSTKSYDDQGNVVAEVDSAGNEVRHTYDSEGRRTSTIDADGVTRTFAIDANGQVIGDQVTIDRDGQDISLSSTLRRDANGRVIENIDALGESFSQQYNGLGQLTELINQTGNSVSFNGTDNSVPEEYVFDDGSITGYEFDANGNPISFVNQEGNRTRYEYNERNDLVRIILPDETPDDDTDNPVQSFEYDAAGRRVASIDALGRRTTFEFNALGQQVASVDALGQRTTYRYDSLGRFIEEMDSLGRSTALTYDAAGQLTGIRFADGTQETREYDTMGNLVAITDAAGQTSRFEFNGNQQLIRTITATGFVTTFQRDEFGNVIRQIDARGNATEFEYNALSEQTSLMRPLGQTSTTEYDGAGRVSATTDFNGQRTTYVYDDLGRLVSQVFEDGSRIDITFTPSGNRATVTDANGTTRFEYDARDRLVSQTEPDGTIVSYGYDAVGNLTVVQTPFGTTTYTYDALDRIESVMSPADGETRYFYDSAGRLTETLHANGVAEKLSYDELDRLTEIRTERESVLINDPISFEYDPVGNLLQKVEGNELTTYQYDAMNRLVGERVARDGSILSTSIWEYDEVGNLLREVVDGAETVYIYDQNDRLIEVRSEGDVETRTYDANGSQLTSTAGSETKEYEWDAQGRLKRVSNGGVETAYQYNADGLRVALESGGQETKFLWSSVVGRLPEVIAEYGDLETRQYVYGSGRDEIIVDGDQFSVQSDQLGSTRTITDDAGVVVNEYTYDVWGNLSASLEGIENQYRFTGGFFDDATNTTYLRARYLDNEAGRFVSTDPFAGVLTDPQSLHRYQYAHQNPLTFVDPSGEVSELTKQLVSLSVKVTLAGIVAAGVQYAWSKAVGGMDVRWRGVTGSAGFGATAGIDKGPVEAGVTGGFGAGATALISTLFVKDGKAATRGAGLTHVFANSGVALAIKADGGAGAGGVTVNTPSAEWINNLGVYRFGPTYAVLADFNASAGVGRSKGAFLQIGFGSGNAAGLSISTSVGGSVNFVGGVTIPIGEGEAGSEAYQQAISFINNFN